MNSEVEIKQNFNDTLSNTMCIECNMTQKNIFPIEEIHIKEEPIEYENEEQKKPPEAIIFNQNIDGKSQETNDCKITYNLSDDCKSLIHHQIKCETNQMDTSPVETDIYNKEGVHKAKVLYSNNAFKVDPNGIFSNTIYTECNIAQKNVFPLAEIDTKSECLEIEESKITYNLIHHQFTSENGEMDYIPPDSTDCMIEITRHADAVHNDAKKTKFVEGYTGTPKMLHKCPKCIYKSDCKSELKKHLTTHGVSENRKRHLLSCEKKFKCTQCPYGTNVRSDFNRHLKRHLLGSEKEFKCAQCSYSTNFKWDLKIHVQKKHEKVREYKCKRCNYKANCKSRMEQHILNHDSAKSYACDICNKLFKTKSNLKRHKLCHTEEKKFQCAQCDYKTNSKLLLVVHGNRKHLAAQDKEYKCAKCNYETDSQQIYETHLESHTMKIKRIFKCSQCAYKTNFKCALNRHTQHLHSKAKVVECDVCSKQFKHERLLKQHVQRVHISEKKYNCKECNYKTNDKMAFTGHVLTHHSN